MGIKSHYLIIIAILLLPVAVPAQYYGPESVVFDYTNNRYLVANYYNGSIVQVDLDGNPQAFISGQGHCLGMCIVDDILYVSCNYYLRGFDLATLDTVMNITCSLDGHFDGMTVDGAGNLYVIDTGGSLLKVDLDTQVISVFMHLNLPGWPQDCVYDEQNDRIIVVTWATNAPIRAVDLADSSMYDVLQYSIGQWDGITIDEEGNFYLASHANLGCIFRYDNVFANDPDLISQGHAEPAGLCYNNRHDVLAVPNFGGNSVDFIEITTAVDDANNILPADACILGNYPNPFNNSTTIEFSLAKAEEVQLNIFDILGRRVETIYSGFRESGTHKLVWNAKSLASGFYLCELKTSQEKNYLRMMFMK